MKSRLGNSNINSALGQDYLPFDQWLILLLIVDLKPWIRDMSGFYYSTGSPEPMISCLATIKG